MYAKGFAVAILSDGKPLRESNRVVRLRFGSEYQIRIKNTTNRRALASVEIDGMNVLSSELVLQPNQTIDLERFCLDGDLTKGKKFRFVSADSSEVQDPTSKENGLIRVSIKPELTVFDLLDYTPPGMPTLKTYGGSGGSLGGYYSCVSPGISNAPSSIMTTNAANINTTTNASDKGATVEGGFSDQQFENTNESFWTDTPIVIELQMRGLQQEVKKPWEVVQESGKTVVRFNDQSVGHVQNVSIDSEYVTLRIPFSQVSIKI